VRISPVVIVPPVLVVLLAARKVPVRTCLLLGLVAGGLMALLYQGATPVALIRYAVLGFRGESYPPVLSQALRSSGLAGAINMALLLLFAGAYTGIMESSDMMGAITGGLVGKLRSRASFLAGAMALSAASSILASNQALSVVIPARVLSDKGREMGVPPESLAGAFADSGVALAGVIPWNLMAAISGQALQCPVVVYAPYAFLALALPIVGAMLILVEAWTDRHRASIKA
jgi:NhaC family Na+:H+ antiporter